MLNNKYNVEYVCSWCGKRVKFRSRSSRSLPGTCTRKTKGTYKTEHAHTWIINRHFKNTDI